MKLFTKIGHFFKRIGLWFKNHAPTKRRLIQLYAALLTNANIKGFINGRIYTGNSKNVCVPGLNCYSCPGAVGACPLGALQNALASSNTRAPVYVIGILGLIGLIFARTVCGFLCPMGLGQDLLYKIKTPKLKKSRVTRVLSYFKYVLLVVLVIAMPLAFSTQMLPVPAFCKYICPAGTFEGAIGLLSHPANADLFAMLGYLFTWKFALLNVFFVGSVFIYRFFCRFFCPLGAIYGFFNKIALLGVKVEKDKCTDCGLCVAACKMDVRKVGDHECINCGECMSVCPTKAIRWKGSKIFVHADDTSVSPATEKMPSLLTLRTEAQTASPALLSSAAASATASEEFAVSAQPSNAPKAAAQVQNRLAKIVKITAVALALLLLVAALVYYNFIDKPQSAVTEGNQVGDLCPDFTLDVLSEEGGSYTLHDHLGKVTVINFWGTWCTPCVAELPHFIDVAAEYSEQVSVVAIHSTTVLDDVNLFIDSKGWRDSNLIFLQDKELDSGYTVFTTLGGKDTWPTTLILDAEGIIRFVRQGSLTYEELKEQVDIVLGEVANEN